MRIWNGVLTIIQLLSVTLLTAQELLEGCSNMTNLPGRGRSTIARTVCNRMLVDEQHRRDPHTYWYYVDRSKLPEELCSKLIQFHQDEETTIFLENCYEKADWLFVQIGHSLAKSVLSWFMTSTSVNGLLGRGSMFIFSREQLAQLLDVDETFHADNLLDLGAGDGMVTSQLARYFTNVYTTEASYVMERRLREKGYNVLDIYSWENIDICFDLIGCLNLLDRCDKPMSILHAIRKQLKAGTGRVVVAVVLPFEPYVEAGYPDHRPTEYIRVNGSTFEEQVVSLVKDVFEPSGFSIVRFTRLPYLCEGDIENSFYVLDDAVFVLKPIEDG